MAHAPCGAGVATLAATFLHAAVALASVDRPDPRAYDGPTSVDDRHDTSFPRVTVQVSAESSAPPMVVAPPRVAPPSGPPPQPASRLPAAEPERQLRIRPVLDLSIVIGAAAPSLALGLWVTPSLPRAAVVPGSPDDVGRLDRGALGRFDDASATASDALLGVSIAAPLVVHALEAGLRRRGVSSVRGRGFLPRYGTDLVIYAEVLAINGLLTQILKASIRRPRPYTYLDPEDVDPSQREELIDAQSSVEATWSFPSGHASTAFAASSAGATLLTLELLGRAHWAIAVAWIGGTGIAATTGALRVLSGRHFTSDVVTSSLFGTAVGIAVPLAHWRPPRSGDVVRERAPRRWALAPLRTRGGGGLSVVGSLP